jgi:hypothetical protein
VIHEAVFVLQKLFEREPDWDFSSFSRTLSSICSPQIAAFTSIVLAGMFYDSLEIIAVALRFTRIQGMEKRDRRREDNSRRHKNTSEEAKTMVEDPKIFAKRQKPWSES